MSRHNQIPRVEINIFNIHPLFCPFCVQKVLDLRSGAQASEGPASPCSDTLFIANDEGFEFRSARLDGLYGWGGAEGPEPELPEGENYETFTDKVPMRDAIKFAFYAPAPAFFGVYVGFAAAEEPGDKKT